MAVNKSFNGTTYSIPTTAGENGWTNLTNFLQALADYAAVKTTTVQAIRTATTSPITISATSDFAVNVALSVAGVSTVTLPVGASGQMFCIIDGNGDSATYNITVQGSSSQTINGASTYVMTSNKQAAIFQFNGTEWKVITEYPGATLRVSKGGTGLTAVGSALQVLRTNAGATALEWATAGSGDVVGPASSTDNALVRSDGATGKLVQNSGVIVDDSNNMSAASYTATGGTAANNTMYVASNVLRFRGGTSGLGFNNSSGTEIAAVTDAGAWTLGNTTKIGSNDYAGQLLVGRTNGTAIAAGYVGERVQSTQSTATNFPATTVYGDAVSISLTPGVWQIFFLVTNVLNGAAATKFSIGVSTTSGNSITGLTDGNTSSDTISPTSATDSQAVIPGLIAYLTSTTTYYGKVRATYSSGTPQYRCRLTAVRIA